MEEEKRKWRRGVKWEKRKRSRGVAGKKKKGRSRAMKGEKER